ncbi:MAG: alpha/beta fold hydrolase [Pseudomonadota bacterium]
MTSIVFLPGFMCDARLFAPQIDRLRHRFNIVPVTPVHASISDMAAMALSAAPDRFALVGLSMGGIVALEMLRQAGERVTNLILMDATARADADENYDVRTRQINAVHSGHLDKVMREELKPAYLCDGPNKAAILALCMDMARRLGPSAFAAQAVALRDRASLESMLASISIPTLVMCGQQDRVIPLDRHQALATAIPGARLDIIENAGHLPTLEQPDAVNDILDDWLGER